MVRAGEHTGDVTGDTDRRRQVSDVRFVAASDADHARGLLYFVSFDSGPFRVDGVTVRRTRDGRRALSFPARHDGSGRQRPIVRPVDDDARRAIEAQVFAALEVKSAEAAS
jgi:DNA-binding cell septation regulator SpoVG